MTNFSNIFVFLYQILIDDFVQKKIKMAKFKFQLQYEFEIEFAKRLNLD